MKKPPLWITSLSLFFVILSSCAISLCAQQPQWSRIAVGDPAISGANFKPYKNLWKFSATLQDGTIRNLGTWSDELVSVERNGRSFMQRTQVATYSANNRTTTDVNIFDPKTLAPVEMDWKASDGAFNHREFDGASISFKRLSPPGGKIEQGVAKLEMPVFDFHGGMYGLLIAGLPLKEGHTASIPTIDEQNEILTWVNVHVYRREPVSAGAAGNVAAWYVEADTNQGLMKFWLTKTPPYIIRLIFYSSNGVTWTYEMV